MRFEGRKVFVTGASRGIGRAVAQAFQAEGAWVIGTCTGAGSETSDFCQEWVVADFSDIGQIKSCADFVCHAEPDILINNAGANKISPFVEIGLEDFQFIQQINILAPFLLCQAAIPSMIRKRWGRIVNISSIWGKVGKEFRASYSASKFALDGMTVAMAAEVARDGVLVNCVSPGFVDTDLTRQVLGEDGMRKQTEMIPVRRLGTPEEIAAFVAWLASSENTYISGQNIAIDGGFTRV